jgi:hypothetical protein
MTNPMHIVRDQDMEEVHRFVANGSRFLILNLYSIRGIGRTSFLQSVWEAYREQRPTAFVRVPDFLSKDEEVKFRLDLFLAQIVDQLYTTVSFDTLSGADRAHQMHAPELAQRVVELVEDIANTNVVPLLLIDDYDQLPAGSRTVFEDTVLGKIVEQPRHVAVILSSEQKLRFTDRLDLRIRLKHHLLKPLGKSDIVHSLPEYTELAPELLKWTGGMPSLIEYLVDRASEKNIVSLDEYSAHKTELLDQEYRVQIRNAVFPDIRIASDEVIDILALLRRFDVSVLKGILPKINPDIFASYKQKHYLDLIRELGSRIHWRDQGGYALDDTLWAMLSSYISTFEPTTYAKVNRVAVEMYEEWLQEEYRQNYLIEMLYHRMALEKMSDSDQEAIAAALSNLLLGYLTGQRERGPGQVDELDSLKHALTDDPDIRSFIQQEAFDAIDRMLAAKS